MSQEDIKNILIRLTDTTGFDQSNRAIGAFGKATDEIERLLAAERERVREMCANEDMIAAALYRGVPKSVRHAIEAAGYVQKHWETVFAYFVAQQIRQLDLTEDLAPSTGEEKK